MGKPKQQNRSPRTRVAKTLAKTDPLDLDPDVEALFSEGGALSSAISDFLVRPEQGQMAAAIAAAIEQNSNLVVEAGTGTGKTFAYLAPCLLSKKKIIISTATKTLQDQLISKDLPKLLKTLGISLRVQSLKGRGNYICRHRAEFYANEASAESVHLARDIAYVRDKLPQLTQGQRSELPELAEDSHLWPWVTSTADNCLGHQCAYHASCFLTLARKKAMEADLVVINHHVFFADSRLKDQGFGELLPNAQVVVFDEAHHIPDIVCDVQSSQFGTRQIRELWEELMREWPILQLQEQLFDTLTSDLDACLSELWIQTKAERETWTTISQYPGFAAAWQQLRDILARWTSILTEDARDLPALITAKARASQLCTQVAQFSDTSMHILRWVERFKRAIVFHQTPLDSASYCQSLFAKNQAAYIFTSATLTSANSFSHFTQQMGLSAPQLLQLSSPFNFQEQALIYLPRGLPDPNHPLYEDGLLSKALPVIEACQGRCFFLFTSHRALQYMAERLRQCLNLPILVQGEEAKPILLERFRALGNAVLLGTASFWEGIDVKGELLSCVIIDKIPFSNPRDPVIRAKMNYWESKGLSGFEDIALPAAVIALKQGVGRLIRDHQDRGVLMLADPRLTGRAYGQAIFSSLPPMPKTRDEQKVIAFIQSGFCL